MTQSDQTQYAPQCVALEITLRCNMACLHCGSDASRRERPSPLSLKEWCSLIDELAGVGARHITLSGGEPFLYSHWRELIQHIRSHKMGANFISNGSVVTEDDVRFLIAQGVEHIGVSLDGDEAVHDHIRCTPGSFRKVLSLIALGRRHGLAVIPATSISKMNFEVRERILQTALENQVSVWQVQIVNSFGRAGKMRAQTLLEPGQYAQLCRDIQRWQREYQGRLRIFAADSIGYCHPLTDELLGDFEWQGCNAGMEVVGILADGTVMGCLSLQDRRFAAGNVRERSFTEIWSDDSRFAYTRQYDPSQMTGACGTCDARRQCKAGCLGMAYSLGETIYENPLCYRQIAQGQ